MENAPPRMVDNIFFFERENGKIFTIDGDEAAWAQLKNRNRIFVEDRAPKLIGTSNGRHYQEVCEQARELAKTDMEAAKALVKKGFEEEVEIARKNLRMPANYDRVDRWGRPTNQ